MARKQVTIPLGFDTDDIDIGNKNQVSGLNWEFWYAYIGDVRNTLGETNYNLGLLCKSVNVNIWAAFKPWQVTNTQAEDHGMIIDVNSDISWQKPDNDSGYYLDHFLGYNHAARVPGVFTLIGGTIYFESNTTINRSFQLTLPEFDVRHVHNSINRLIRQQLGEATKSSIELTDAFQTDGFISGQVAIQTDISEAVQTVEIQMWLGFDLGGGNYEELCNYPSAAGGEYITSFNAYRVLAGMVSLEYQDEGAFEPPDDEIRMTCLTIHPDILISYEFKGERSQTEGDFSDPTLVLVSQASSVSSTGLVSQPPDGYYRFRTILTYDIGSGEASKTSDWSYITIGMGGGGT